MNEIDRTEFFDLLNVIRAEFETLENKHSFALFADECRVGGKLSISMVENFNDNMIPRNVVIETATHLKIMSINQYGVPEFYYAELFNGVPGILYSQSLKEDGPQHPKIKSFQYMMVNLEDWFNYIGRIVNWYATKDLWRKHHIEAINNFHDIRNEAYFRQHEVISIHTIVKSFWSVEFEFNPNTVNAVKNIIALAESLPLKE